MITPDLIRMLNPTHPTPDVTAQKLQSAAARFAITDPRSVAAWLANLAVESSLIPQRENLYYSTPSRLAGVYPSFFDPRHGGQHDPLTYLRSPERLANLVYANRGGNGDEASGEGYRFRGGGMIQTTFKDNYATTGRLIGFDLIATPELIEQIGVSALAAAAYWTRMSSADRAARAGDIRGTRRAVNGPRMLDVDRMAFLYAKALPLVKA